MKLSKLYTNMPSLFDPIEFQSGLNVVLAEIRLPENLKKDTHNLGKTTIGRLLDFCLLSKRDANFFLFKHPEIFNKFIFFLEIELPDSTFLTIRRSVEEATKICFKKHLTAKQDFSTLPILDWDHVNMPFQRSVEMLDSLLDLRDLKPWTYRKGLGYLLRSQNDYRDVFQLGDYVGKHSDWKPYLAHILGFNAELVGSLYFEEDEIKKKKNTEGSLRNELDRSLDDLSKIEGLLLLKQQEVDKKQKFLDAFDFRNEDKQRTIDLTNEIDDEISFLNNKRYSYFQNKKKIENSLKEDQILFNPENVQKLFQQAGVLFEGQIKKDFQQLIDFNKAITDERKSYLEDELKEISAEIGKIDSSLEVLGLRRSELLSFLSSNDVLAKYKDVSSEIATLRSDIISLGRQRDNLHRLQELRTEIRAINEKIGTLQAKVENDVETQNTNKESLFTAIRVYFNDIIEEVISRKALLTVSTNQEGHLEFKAAILDEAGNETSADDGHTYRKLLCIAFDLAVLRAHLDNKYPRFVFHDGVFESLDNRKKENLLGVLRRYSSFGIQAIITLIDSELPYRSDKDIQDFFSNNEIILRLNDENDKGRLFKMAEW